MDFEAAVKELTELAKSNQNVLTQADLTKYCALDSADYDKLYNALCEEFEIQEPDENEEDL
jgi:acyl carrier protein